MSADAPSGTAVTAAMYDLHPRGVGDLPTLHTLGLLTPGSTLPSAFPGPKAQWRTARFTSRSQWRDRVGLAPTSRTRAERDHSSRSRGGRVPRPGRVWGFA